MADFREKGYTEFEAQLETMKYLSDLYGFSFKEVKQMFEHKEDDNLNMEEIERYRKMSQEERDELMKELEKEEKEKIAESKK